MRDVADDVYVEAHAYIGSLASIGGGTVVGAGAYIAENVSLGRSVWVKANVSLMSGCVVGDRVVLQPGCVIGSDGFGWAFVDGRAQRIPQVGNVVLEDDVEMGANTCIDRAQTGSTIVGAGTKIDNLVQIGHNCRIGKHCVIASLTGLAGSTVIGDYVKCRGSGRIQRTRYGGLGRDDCRPIRRVGQRRGRRDDFGQSGTASPRRASPRGHDS